MKIKNILVGQSGGPTAVINSSLAGVFETAKRMGCEKVYAMQNGIEGILEGKFFDLSERLRNSTDIELLKQTPSSYLGSCRYKLPEVGENDEIYERLFAFFKEHEISAVFYIGGNDSMDTVRKLYDYGKIIKSDVLFMGVPKTIDNDLEVTDHTPGFGSSAKFIATVTKELCRDSLVYDVKSVTVIEIMGRDSGWLAGSAALAKGVDCVGPAMIFLPEVPFDYEYVKRRTEEIQKTQKSIVIAISEGVRDKDGNYLCTMGKSAKKDVFGHVQLSKAGDALASMLKEDLGIKTRAVELSTLQRCASHIASLCDINEAFAVGSQAVKSAFEGKSGEMVLLERVSDIPYTCVTGTADVHNIANLAKTVPESFISETKDYVTDKFIDYALPLIKGEMSLISVDGLYRQIDLKG